MAKKKTVKALINTKFPKLKAGKRKKEKTVKALVNTKFPKIR
jgi:hypothetical protein